MTNPTPDTPERWCPEHGLHDEWHNGWCAHQDDSSNEYCMSDPIAPEVVAAIEARGAARERAAVAKAAADYRSELAENASGLDSLGVENVARIRRRMGDAVLEFVRDYLPGPDPLAEHDARVKAEARRQALEDAAAVARDHGALMVAGRIRALARGREDERARLAAVGELEDGLAEARRQALEDAADHLVALSPDFAGRHDGATVGLAMRYAAEQIRALAHPENG